MKQAIFLLTVFSFLLIFINNKEVLANRDKREPKDPPPPPPLSPKDPRLAPEKYCQGKCAPTIRPVAPFDVVADTKAIRGAAVGKGTNADTIVNIVTKRGVLQRLEIANDYETRYPGFHNDRGDAKLVSNLRGRLGGKFESTIAALMTPLPVFLAKELQESIVPVGTDEVTLVEVLCSINNFGIKAVAEFYDKAYKKPLATAIREDTTGSFQKVIVSLAEGKRAEGPPVDRPKVEADAKALTKPGPKNWKVVTSEFSNILGTNRSYGHLRDVFGEYRKISGHEIEDDITKEFPGPASAGLIALVKCIKSRPEFLATKLHESINGKVQDRPLIRILVSRSEIDLEDIKIAYEKLFKKTVRDHVADKIGSYYRRTMTNVILGNAVK